PPAWDQPSAAKTRAFKQIDPVMAFPTDLSPYGVFDLAGNAWEWTADWFDPSYYQQLGSGPAENPTGPAHSRSKSPQVAIRGGSKSWLACWREGMKPDAHLPFLGFRCVLPLNQPAPAAPQQAPAQPTDVQTGTPTSPNGGVVPF